MTLAVRLGGAHCSGIGCEHDVAHSFGDSGERVVASTASTALRPRRVRAGRHERLTPGYPSSLVVFPGSAGRRRA